MRASILGQVHTPTTPPTPARRGVTVATDRHGWSGEVAAEFDAPVIPTKVGTTLLGRVANAKVWMLRLSPGERFPTHQHRHSYLWLATSSGRASQHVAGGDTQVVDYTVGDHELTNVPVGTTFDHDLVNLGNDDLTFITVELVEEPALPSTQTDQEAPASHLDLLDGPLFAHMATIRPDGSPQSSAMWFDWDGGRLRFTHTNTRQKVRNLRHDPRVSVHIQDPHAPYRTLEIRGTVESIEPDHDAAFYRRLQHRYDKVHPIYDADDRVVITVRPTRYVAVDGGLTHTEQQHLHRLLEQLPADRPTE